MAADLGATSLADVHQEELDQTLQELATLVPAGTNYNSRSLGVPVLDALLDVFTLKPRVPSHAQSDVQHQSRPPSDLIPLREQQNSEDEEMLRNDMGGGNDGLEEPQVPSTVLDSSGVLLAGPSPRIQRPSPVVEVSSSLSASGKSQLLYYLTALAVLPHSCGEIPVGGRDAAVVFVDTDGRFNADRLRMVGRGIVQSRQGRRARREVSEDDLETVLASSLQHVHVLRPQSSSALLATLRSLDAYLFDLPRHRSASRPLHMIAIDSATAFFWQDRLRDEVARAEDIGRSRDEIEREREQKQSFYLSDLYTDVARELKRLQGQLGCAVVYTATVSSGRSVINNDPSAAADPSQFAPQTFSLRPTLPAPWGTFPLLRLIVHRDSVRMFPPTMSAQDARNDAPLRQSVVRQGKFSAWVNAWGRDQWPRRVVDGIQASSGGVFSFYVRESGVEIPDE
ncbi:hypothetical protein NUU61_003431 [Penicillium alfredii]|uniref:DNA recombination and repair protein Rad51-like C-terminal domain-containing protein n=1 Tax=Penicillium alfredii TaxID=1506179 RepID=A0A9W9FTJ5_9EURO|nr:uncharacterized protein NUU61_003431 [Penicillium alfredii]KAJ5106084.1 hypothetical protein NUU61_003431 [Penicillium alfredii]